MKILVIGSGGREHALAWKLARSPDAERIFCAPGNAGTAEIAENVAISSGDLKALVRFARENRIDLTVIGPDDPLAAGIVDLFAAEKLRAFGPTKSAARIEASKIFAKELMRAQKIPTAEARTFTDSSEALDYCERLKFPVVIKADGLALGKGVIIASDAAAARSAIDEMMTQGRFGDAGRRIVIEDFLRGTECSLHALVDGSSYRLLESARDHKRALDGDQGPNTGGMGAFSPANNWNDKLQFAIRDGNYAAAATRSPARGNYLSRTSLSRLDNYQRWRPCAGIQLPFRRPGNSGAFAPDEIRFAAAVGSDD